MRVNNVTSTGVGDDQTVAISRETKLVIIYNSSDADIDVFLRALANIPSLPVPSNSVREIAVGCNVNQLVCQFSAAATIFVEERK
jgi:hypothetical protein